MADYSVVLILSLLCVVLGGILFLSFKRNRGRIFNGFLFNMLMSLIALDFIALSFTYENPLLRAISLCLMILVLLVFLLGYYILIIGLIKNAKHLIQKEGIRFSNLLTLFAALGLIVFIFVIPLLSNSIPQELRWAHTLLACITFSCIYLIFVFINFLSSSFLYQFFKPHKDCDFIIVLGSGLRNGNEVPPLLAARIDVALEYYHHQKVPPLLIFSGGQGEDECVPEGQAMRDYALAHDIPKSHALMETQSTTTYENMLFSKKMMDAYALNHPYTCLFSSNTFHIFRASQYARQVGLDAQGIGAKTAAYFVPNAMIREFIALMVMHRRIHLSLNGLAYSLIFLASLL
ncbi:YdcF family protein [Erysipelothrix amsterdamensis]|uniref:YdcF family protein n=1 Tax=Erysipelothrix amsterdamensis TaxID=2929157 RepID=A0AAU9VIC6_9FIRM|nr:YdcF family protein [Erysipelothrix sp. A18Y020d]CAH2761306.1 YdcF family protein [Erysipelothrix sp. A18Y020d]